MTSIQTHNEDDRSRNIDPASVKESVSPLKKFSIEPDLLKKVARLEQEQKKLIASREHEKLQNPSKEATLSPPSSVSAPSPQLLVTPPLSSTQTRTKLPYSDISAHTVATVSEQTNAQGKKKRSKPAPLDVDALRRERQYSGPYSSNPILNKKRSHSQISGEVEKGSELSQPKRAPHMRNRAEEYDNLQLTPNSGHEVKKNQLASLPQIIAAPFVSPALGRDSFPLTSLHSSSSHHFDGRVSALLNGIPRSGKYLKAPEGERNSQTLSSTVEPFSKPSTMMKDKREKFLDLCDQIWDLFESH